MGQSGLSRPVCGTVVLRLISLSLPLSRMALTLHSTTKVPRPPSEPRTKVSRTREEARSMTRGRERANQNLGSTFIVPMPGGAEEPHVRFSEAAWNQLLGRIRSYELAPCQPLGNAPAVYSATCPSMRSAGPSGC